MKKEEFITERTRIISEMLDNPDENGIYPTTKCFVELDLLYDEIHIAAYNQAKKERKELDKGWKELENSGLDKPLNLNEL